MPQSPRQLDRSGYFPALEWIRNSLNRILAIVFFIPASLIMLAFFVLSKFADKDNGPFLYRGARLGKDKKIFTMYKIRTLIQNAEDRIGAEMLEPNQNLELKFGRFLRETRLDELPQLINVIKGDMTLVGPRPIRPAVYEKIRPLIANYDDRFVVKPGITGYAQFFTAHRAPKEIRSLIDNHFVKVRANPIWDILFVSWSGVQVLRKTAMEMSNILKDRFRAAHSRGSISNERTMKRVKGKHIRGYITHENFATQGAIPCDIVDMNYEAICLRLDADLSVDQRIWLVLEAVKKQTGRRKRARCQGVVYRKTENHDGPMHFRYVVFYEPVTSLHRYLVDQYMLRATVA